MGHVVRDRRRRPWQHDAELRKAVVDVGHGQGPSYDWSFSLGVADARDGAVGLPLRQRRNGLGAGVHGIGQRVRKTQPEGGSIGLGMSPLRMMRSRFARGSGTGAAESSAWV